ncbi:MAG: O-antigen ligase family protein [Bacteroidales bacterium]|nr:O-antigen ligase family protein [Bacteroidales bacterium]
MGFALYKSVTIVDGNWVLNPNSQEYPGINYFRYSNLAFLIHPSYLALYFVFALLSIVFYVKHWVRNKSFVVLRYAVWILAFSLLILGLVLLESRAGVLSLFIFIVAYSIYQVIFHRRYVLSFLIVGIVVLPLVFSVARVDRLSDTLVSLRSGLKYGVDSKSKDDPTLVRLWIWRSAFDVIKENPILGVGNGDSRDVLKHKYLERDMSAAAAVGLNAHNQYLESWLALGILGIIGLLVLLGQPLWLAVKGKDWLLLGFILFFMYANLFESMLETVTGVIYFTLIYVSLCCSKSDLDERELVR